MKFNLPEEEERPSPADFLKVEHDATKLRLQKLKKID